MLSELAMVLLTTWVVWVSIFVKFGVGKVTLPLSGGLLSKSPEDEGEQWANLAKERLCQVRFSNSTLRWRKGEQKSTVGSEKGSG